jgi:integrase
MAWWEPKKKVKKKPVKTRGPRGRGTVFYSKSRKLWIGRLPVGRTAAGRTKYLERTDADRDRCLAKLKHASPPGPDTTVRQWGEQWLAASPVRDSTREDYRHTLEAFAYPEWGHLKVSAVTAHHVEAASRKWAQPAGPLNPNTLRKNLTHLSGMFSAARRARLISENPVSLARKPKAQRVEIDPFTADELNRIIAGATTPATLLFALLAATGMRIGEALALDVQDVRGDTLSITKTYSRAHGTRPPKSERGNRTVRVPKQGLKALRAAVKGRTRGVLFASGRGGRRLHSSAWRAWRALLGRLGIRPRSLHALRHSWISLSVSAGVGIAEVAKHCGDSPNTVLMRYVHATSTDPVAAFEGILSGGKPAARRP